MGPDFHGLAWPMSFLQCSHTTLLDAGTLVKSGLAACVNQIPGITSTYVYKGELHKDQESLLMVKCSKERLGEIAALIRQVPSPYSTYIGATMKRIARRCGRTRSTHVMQDGAMCMCALNPTSKNKKLDLQGVCLVHRQGHPYENPEFICLDVDAGLPAYLNWVLRPGAAEEGEAH